MPKTSMKRFFCAVKTLDKYALHISKAISRSNECLAHILETAPILDDTQKIDLVLHLKPMLQNESTSVVQNVVSILIELTKDFICLPQEIVVSLMKKCMCVLSARETNTALLLEMLLNVVFGHKENQDLCEDTGCLGFILKIFCCKIFKDENQLNELNAIVNFLVASACHPHNDINKIRIAASVIPLTLDHLKLWVENPDVSAIAPYVLKEMLFLCREVMSASVSCQTMFLKCNGIELLTRTLQEFKQMKEHIDNFIGVRRSMFLDCTKTLFSSIVALFDVAVVHYKDACLRAYECNAVNVLENFLDITDGEQQQVIISCIVHLTENNSSLYENVSDIPNSNKKISRDLKLYPKSRLLYPSNFEQSNVQSFKPPKALKTCEPAKFRNEISIHTSNQHFVSTAELMVLMSCVQRYGTNMQAIREVFPFHKEMTAQDLYALWRIIWKTRLPKH